MTGAGVHQDGPLVSLIMAAWQPRRDWLLRAVRSALGQRGCRVELIVVDDGSPDPIEDALAEVDDPRLHVVRRPHEGPSAARNAGIAAARGELTRFVDADDVFGIDSTARLAQRVGRDERLIAYGATLICDDELRPVWKMVSRIEGNAVRQALLGTFAVRVTSMVFPRRVIDATGSWDPAFPASGDWDYVLRALEHARVTGDPGIATFYRRHGKSVTANVAAGQAGARRVVTRYFERNPHQRGTRLEREADARLAAMAARIYLTHGHGRDALPHLRRALALDPLVLLQEAALSPRAAAGKLEYRLRRATGAWREPAVSPV